MGAAWFSGASFAGIALFGGTTFTKRPSFLETTFRNTGSFVDTTFTISTTLEGTWFGAHSNFVRTDLRLVTFRRCHLGGAALNEAYNLALAEFDDCR